MRKDRRLEVICQKQKKKRNKSSTKTLPNLPMPTGENEPRLEPMLFKNYTNDGTIKTKKRGSFFISIEFKNSVEIASQNKFIILLHLFFV